MVVNKGFVLLNEMFQPFWPFFLCLCIQSFPMIYGTSIPYDKLVAVADDIFLKCEEDPKCLSRMIETLDPATRNELLISDLLNAYQVFFYYFRTCPDDLVRERLELEPASSLINGVKIDEIELLELVFSVKDHEPVIIVSDGEQTLTSFKGKKAYAEGLKYIENPPY